LISLAFYAIGVIAGALLTRRVKPDGLWSRAVSWTLLVEAMLITACAFAWAILRSTTAQGMLERNVLLGWIAAAIGIQSGAMLRLKIPGIVTTYITGTWTNLMSGVARLAGGEGPATAGGKKRFEERLLLQAGVLACYLLSAVVAGWLLGHLPQAAGGLTAASVSFAAIYGLIRS
jgi:uncharacterized membrane protein YoaK (UPF0700 family)